MDSFGDNLDNGYETANSDEVGIGMVNADEADDEEYNNHSKSRESLCRLIVSMDLPLNFGESPYFKRFIRESFYPQFQKMTRNTIRSDLIKYYNLRLTALKDEISSSNFCVALSSDIWRGRNAKEHYLSVAAHYIDDEFSMQKRVLGFKLIDGSHDSETIAELILNVVRDFNLSNRIISVTFDNAVENSRAISLLETELSGCVGDFLLRQRCACDIINLIVKSGIEFLKPYLDVIRDAISFLSVNNFAEFKSYCESEGLSPRKLVLDTPEKWNSTYLMLKNTIPYKNALTAFVNLKHGSVLLEESHWIVAKFCSEFLEILYDSIISLSNVYLPTSPVVIHTIFDLLHVFASHNTDSLLSPCISRMEEELKKYWKDIPHLYLFSLILDPRLKIMGTNFLLKTTGKRLDVDHEDFFANIIRPKFDKLYEMYEKRFSYLRNKDQPGRNTSWAWYYDDLNSESGSELNNYLETGLCKSYDDDYVLRSWRDFQFSYPVLSRLACDILTAPVSTVSSESAFSTIEKVLENGMASLTSEMVEIFTCLKDWERSGTKMQHTARNDDLVAYFENLSTNYDSVVDDHVSSGL